MRSWGTWGWEDILRLKSEKCRLRSRNYPSTADKPWVSLQKVLTSCTLEAGSLFSTWQMLKSLRASFWHSKLCINCAADEQFMSSTSSKTAASYTCSTSVFPFCISKCIQTSLILSAFSPRKHFRSNQEILQAQSSANQPELCIGNFEFWIIDPQYFVSYTEYTCRFDPCRCRSCRE